MNPTLADFSPDELERHVSGHLTNCIGFYMKKSRVGDWHEADGYFRMYTGYPNAFGNVIGGANFQEADAPAKIAEAIAPFVENPVPCMWLAGPDSSPSNLSELLAKNGLSFIGSMPGMVLDISTYEPDELPKGITIETVHSDQQLDIWIQVLADGYGLPYEVADLFRNVTRESYTEADSSVVAFICRADGMPAACSCIFDFEGTTGIYCVATLADFRNRGLGRAITSASISAGRERGSNIALLQASEMGKSVYEKLGFRTVTTINMFTVGALLENPRA